MQFKWSLLNFPLQSWREDLVPPCPGRWQGSSIPDQHRAGPTGMAAAALPHICCSPSLLLRRGCPCLESPAVLPEVMEFPRVVLKFSAGLSVLSLGWFPWWARSWADLALSHLCHCLPAQPGFAGSACWGHRVASSTGPCEAVTKLRVSVILAGALGSPLTVQCLPLLGYSTPRVCLHLPQLVCLCFGCFQNLLHPSSPVAVIHLPWWWISFVCLFFYLDVF